ncbi:MAG: hypothetical protein K2L21_05745 [Muribaculaceae bacterium]|nr:hypothetical protein [Muribaculaceae bacterium]
MRNILKIIGVLIALTLFEACHPKVELSYVLKRASFNEFRAIVPFGRTRGSLCLFSNYDYDSCGIFADNDFSATYSGKWALSNDTLFLEYKEQITISADGEYRQVTAENDSDQYLIKDDILYLIMDSTLFKNKSHNLKAEYRYCGPYKIKKTPR